MKIIIQWINYIFKLIGLQLSYPKSKKLDISKLGINSFYNDVRFGTMAAQANEIKNKLKLNYQRVLFVWDDNTQKTKKSKINFSHIDKVIKSQVEGTKLLIVVTGVPSWAEEKDNITYTTYADMFHQLCLRYKNNPIVEGYQIWNEPDMESVNFNHRMDFIDKPENYFKLLEGCSIISKLVNPSKIITNAATRSINQKYPNTLKYNKKLISLGAEKFVDVYSIHWYGEQFEKLFLPNGILDFVNSLNKPIWMTESGIESLDQLRYASITWPYLLKKIKNLERIYHYIYHEAGDSEIAFGMKIFKGNELDVSDLFTYLISQGKS